MINVRLGLLIIGALAIFSSCDNEEQDQLISNEDGEEPTDLDQCRGHYDETRGYHYHVDAAFYQLLGRRLR